jgi:tRNA-specific 2-thiouridylase
MLAARGLTPPLKAESQEVCFVPDDDYRAFLRARGLDRPHEGPIIKDGREIGRHHGLWNYTLGQRRGIRVAWSEPLYVIGKDSRQNALLVGGADELPARGCIVRDLNFMVPIKSWPGEIFVQTRYRQKARPATADLLDSRLVLSFTEPQTLPTPGQIAAVYDGEGLVLAGGIIES